MVTQGLGHTTRWILTTGLTIAAAAISTFMSTQASLGRVETQVESVNQKLETHASDRNVHIEQQRQIEHERRMSRVEYTLEAVKEDVQEIRDAIKRRQ